MNGLILETILTESWHGLLRNGIKYISQLSPQRDEETEVFIPKIPTLLAEGCIWRATNHRRPACPTSHVNNPSIKIQKKKNMFKGKTVRESHRWLHKDSGGCSGMYWKREHGGPQ